MGGSLSYQGVRAILLDIEGTTTPVDFVYQVLFTYARAKVKSFLEEHPDAASPSSSSCAPSTSKTWPVALNLPLGRTRSTRFPMSTGSWIRIGSPPD